jgi:hypothetical protein
MNNHDEAFSQAFAEQSSTDRIRERIDGVHTAIQEKAKLASILTEEAKGKMRAVAELYSSLQPDQQDALGKVVLLERTLNTGPRVIRPTREVGSEIAMRYLGSPLEETAIGVLRNLNIAAGFIDEVKLYRLQSSLEGVDPDSPDAEEQIGEIARAVNYQPESPRISPRTSAQATRSTDLAAAFAPRDVESAIQERKEAIRSRLKQVAGMGDVLTDEARATMRTAVGYLDSLSQGGDIDVTGGLQLLEDALGMPSRVTRAAGERGAQRGDSPQRSRVSRGG